MKFRNALRAGIVFGAAFAATLALAQAYTVTTNDTVKLSTGGPGGSGIQVPFTNAVAQAVALSPTSAPCASTAPSVGSGFGTNSAVVKASVACAFSLSVGTTASSNGVINLPQAADGWSCEGQDVTTSSNAIFLTKMTAETVNSVTVDGFQSNGAVGNWVANDVIAEQCAPF